MARCHEFFPNMVGPSIMAWIASRLLLGRLFLELAVSWPCLVLGIAEFCQTMENKGLMMGRSFYLKSRGFNKSFIKLRSQMMLELCLFINVDSMCDKDLMLMMNGVEVPKLAP